MSPAPGRRAGARPGWPSEAPPLGPGRIATDHLADASVTDMKVAAGVGFEIGDVKMGAYAVSDQPTVWMLCNGAALSRRDYPRLFTKIGTFYGVGDGSTTFNLPDLRDAFAIMVGSLYATALGQKVGAGAVNIQHNHGPGTVDLAANVDIAHGHGSTTAPNGETQSNAIAGGQLWVPNQGHTHPVVALASTLVAIANKVWSGLTGNALSTTQSIIPPSVGFNYFIRVQ